jgi:hypothetical protein
LLVRPSKNARKLRRRRHRERLGLKVFSLTLDLVAIECLLENEQLLPPGVEHSHAQVEAALATFLQALCDIEL